MIYCRSTEHSEVDSKDLLYFFPVFMIKLSEKIDVNNSHSKIGNLTCHFSGFSISSPEVIYAICPLKTQNWSINLMLVWLRTQL